MIKVLKPGIEDILVADLNFIYIVARILEFLSPDLSRASLVCCLSCNDCSIHLVDMFFLWTAKESLLFSDYWHVSIVSPALTWSRN